MLCLKTPRSIRGTAVSSFRGSDTGLLHLGHGVKPDLKLGRHFRLGNIV